MKFVWPFALTLITCAAAKQVSCTTDDGLDMDPGLNLLQVNISMHSKNRAFPTTPITEPSVERSLLTEVDVSEREKDKSVRSSVQAQHKKRRTKRGLLQASPTATTTWSTRAGFPMNCNIPQCNRSADCHEMGNASSPMCCSTQMFEAVSEITGWMEANDVEYTLLYGTLLGAYRDHDIIPWTDDIDIGIFSKDVAKLIAQKDIPWSFAYTDGWFIPRGCENGHPGFPGNYSTIIDDGLDVFQAMKEIDIDTPEEFQGFVGSYFIEIDVIDTEHSELADCYQSSFGTEYIGQFNTSTVQIRNKTFRAPLFTEDALACEYGETWYIQDADEHAQGYDIWGLIQENKSTDDS